LSRRSAQALSVFGKSLLAEFCQEHTYLDYGMGGWGRLERI
jgi:hypothetical protein